jgi:N-acetylmuramoyl-L-alanine amidase
MIVLVKKSNMLLIGLVFLLLVAIYSLNIGNDRTVSVTNDEKVQRIVVLDAGHGGEDPGAVSDYSGIKEKDVNLIIAKKAKELLENEGYKVLLTREEDVLVYEPGTQRMFQKRKQDLLKRKKMMDESGADAVVSVHLNKFEQTQYHGAQVFFPHNSPDSTKLAVSIQKSIKETADPRDYRQALVRGKVNELPIIIFRDLKVPTVVVECGFLSNVEEDSRLASEEYQGKLALAIKQGIVNYFNAK